MPFKTFSNWLFDGNIDSPFPVPKKDDEGTVIVPDIMKYNSPITNNYVISIFLKIGNMNSYLNKYFNNVGVWYLEKDDLFKFIKRCVIDFKVKRWDLIYYKRKKEDALYHLLREKLPHLKTYDVLLLSKLINESEQKDGFYQAHGLEKMKKEKIKKTKKIKEKKISVKKLFEEHFSIMEQKQ
jgi:hypothetical protein